MTHGRRKPNGVVIESLPSGREVHKDTVRCCHCQRHHVWKPGKDKVLGFCHRCTGFTCARPECSTICVNWEQQLDNAEAGLSRLHKPASKIALWTPLVKK